MLVYILTFIFIFCGVCVCFIPGIYLIVAWIFAIPLAADKSLDFWTAMELSRKTVNRQWISIFLLLIIAYLPLIIYGLFAYFKISSEIADAIAPFMPESATFSELMTHMTQNQEEIQNAKDKVFEKT